MHKDYTETAPMGSRRRLLALIALGLGTLLVVLDSTVLNVSLPSIRKDLGFDERSLTWAVNAYTLTYGGLLLLSGRLGDIFGPRRLLLSGVALFTVASLACGLASTKALLILGRLLQGIGGSVIVAVSPALAVHMFSGIGERATAIAVLGFVCVTGGSIGLVLGGIVTSALGWHWVFLMNGPVGVLVFLFCLALLPETSTPRERQRIDVWGAVTITASLIVVLYAASNAGGERLVSARTLGLLACSLVLAVAFLIIEARAPVPLMPRHVLKKRNLAVANIVCLLSSAGSLSCSYMLTLYMGGVLGYGPLRISLVFLPASIVGAAFALGLSAKLVSGLGLRGSVGGGLLLAAIGLALFAGATANGATAKELLLCMILVGIGGGVGSNALSVAVLDDVPIAEAGLASGIINTTSLMAGAIGLAILASLAGARTTHLLASGATNSVAMAGGYQVAFVASAACVFLAALMGAALLGTRAQGSDRPDPAGAATVPAPHAGSPVSD